MKKDHQQQTRLRWSRCHLMGTGSHLDVSGLRHDDSPSCGCRQLLPIEL